MLPKQALLHLIIILVINQTKFLYRCLKNDVKEVKLAMIPFKNVSFELLVDFKL